MKPRTLLFSRYWKENLAEILFMVSTLPFIVGMVWFLIHYFFGSQEVQP